VKLDPTVPNNHASALSPALVETVRRRQHLVEAHRALHAGDADGGYCAVDHRQRD